jgi:hypothetical protein
MARESIKTKMNLRKEDKERIKKIIKEELFYREFYRTGELSSPKKEEYQLEDPEGKE